MDHHPAVPAPLRELGRELQPLLQRLHVELATPAVPSVVVAEPAAVLARHLDAVQRLLRGLATSVEGLDTEVAANPKADADDVRRAVGRLAACVDGWVQGLRAAGALRSEGDAAEMPILLAGVYRHVLDTIEPWLERLVRATADPYAECARQGVPIDGSVEVTLVLKLTTPPQVEGLRHWMQRQGASSLLDHVGALILGWALAGTLF